MHPAEEYNKIKNICLSVMHRDGFTAALKVLDGYRDALPFNAWVGLKAELHFYADYFDQYHLEPLNDHGIKADFAGDVDGLRCRIDVTTNLSYKKLELYDPIMTKSHRKYKIAIMDPHTFKLEGFYDLNFPLDATGQGRLFNAAIFMPADYNRHGECRYNYYQKIVTISSANPDEEFIEHGICTDWYLPDIGTYCQDLYDAYEDIDVVNEELEDYLSSSALLLTKTTGKKIVACGYCQRQFLNPKDCTGEYTNIQLSWIDPFVEGYLPKTIDRDLTD